MIDIKEINKFDIKKSVIEEVRGIYSTDPAESDLRLQCKFFNTAEYPYFDLHFESFDENLNLPKDLKGSEIIRINITEKGNYFVDFDLLIDGKPEKFGFRCKNISFCLLEYRGISYKNMYDFWAVEQSKKSFVESAEFLDRENIYEYDGFSLKEKIYSQPENNKNRKTWLKVYKLTAKSFTYSYRFCTHDNDNRPFGFTIDHSNGHRYFPFKLGEYGISYIDVESGEVFNYIPEGMEHDIDDPKKISDSFMIYEINYDPKTNLIAYTGGYPAGPSDVMVGDFSDPLNFDPRLVSVSWILSPDVMPDFDDLFFARFENGKLVVSCDELSERKLSCEDLKNKIKSLGARS